mgnify:FL=1
MTDSINHITFLNNENPPNLEDFHPIFQQVKNNNPNEYIKKELTKFVSYTFNESVFLFKDKHFFILLDYIKNNKHIFEPVHYHFESSHFSCLLRQVITENYIEPAFSQIIAELFNPDRFFISMFCFKNTMDNIINYLEAVIKEKDEQLLKLFFGHKYTVDYFYDYHKEFLININSQFHIPILKSKIFSQIF